MHGECVTEGVRSDRLGKPGDSIGLLAREPQRRICLIIRSLGVAAWEQPLFWTRLLPIAAQNNQQFWGIAHRVAVLLVLAAFERKSPFSGYRWPAGFRLTASEMRRPAA